jgi:hypothetical protein
LPIIRIYITTTTITTSDNTEALAPSLSKTS